MSRSPRRGKSLFQQAVEAFEAGNLAKARELFLRVLEEDGEHQEEALDFLRRLGGGDRYVAVDEGEELFDDPDRGAKSATIPPEDRASPPDRGARLGADITRSPRRRSREEERPRFAFAPPPQAEPPLATTAPESLDETIDRQVLRRTPHMDLSPAPPVAVGQKLMVWIYADDESPREGETAEDLVLEGPADQEVFEVDIWLVVAAPFEVVGPATEKLIVERNMQRSEPVGFTIVRKRRGAGEGALCTAFFAYQGRPCGRVSRTIRLSLEADPVAEPLPAAEMRVDATAQPPDLSVRIVAGDGEGRSFQCLVQTPLLPQYQEGKTETWRLSGLAIELVRQKMSRFTAKGVTNFARTAALVGAGIELFEASPKLFQKVLWELIDAGTPPRTIAITTEEPAIPWELMVPTRTLPNGETEEREPLGVEFLVSRWTAKSHILPTQRIPLRDAYVVAPRDSRLANAEEEAALVAREFPGARIDPAGLESLDAALGQQGRTLLHFICHGKSGEAGSQILILERKEELDAGTLRGLPGVKKAFRAAKPLIFLNACEVGRQEPALMGAGGFAEAFMALGASGVIAPLWSVKDSIAHEIATELYRRMGEEPRVPFTEILRELRKKSYAAGGGEDTYAAYTFYGDPLAARAPAAD